MAVNLASTYLGMNLRSPLVPSASPLSEDLGNLRRMEDAGAAAVVFHSVFEEQLRHNDLTLRRHLTQDEETRAHVPEYFPGPTEFQFDPEQYLAKLSEAKSALGIPIIASLNGTTFGGWTTFAKELERAGADAVELNIYSIPTDPAVSAEEIELNYLSVLAAIKAQVKIPIAVKLSPFFTNLGSFARRLDTHGAGGLVLFNRFYQPDIDVEAREVTPSIQLSAPGSIRLPLRWIAILHEKVSASLAATSGVYRATDVVKLVMAGANVTMLCSVLLRHGIDQIRVIERELGEWMEAHGVESLAEIHGCLSQKNCPDPSAFERAQYMRALAVDRIIQNDAEPVSAPVAR